MTKKEFLETIKKNSPNVDINFIEQVYDFSEQIYKDVKYFTGQPCLHHCMNTALILSELQLDTFSIAGGLLHNIMEVTDTTFEEIKKRFGSKIAILIEGITGITNLKYKSKDEIQAENFRKILLYTSKDIRAILIKLASRLDKMRVLHNYNNPKVVKEIALETQEIYAPLANRLGLRKIKSELEDLALKFLDPSAYNILSNNVEKNRKLYEEYLNEVKKIILRLLLKEEIPARIEGRVKHISSIYRKIKKRNIPLSEIYDILALRIILKSSDSGDCYRVLGLIHSKWQHIPDRLRDFIAKPKDNNYQSLHTTIIGPLNKVVEIQIRTEKMHEVAEMGIAAHWRYKTNLNVKSNEVAKDHIDPVRQYVRDWLNNITLWEKDVDESNTFMEYLKSDLNSDEIYVFTPQFDIKTLPIGSTPIDFAFAVHTDIGLHCVGAKINGKLASLKSNLKNGDIVEILTSPNATPKLSWLNCVKTARAKAKINHFLNEEKTSYYISMGKKMLEEEAKKYKISIDNNKLSKAIADTNSKDLDHLYIGIARKKISINKVFKTLIPDFDKKILELKKTQSKEKPVALPKTSKGVSFGDIDSLMRSYAKCCNPIMGDKIVGFVTRGRGLTIHKADCPNLKVGIIAKEPERKVEVKWKSTENQRFITEIKVVYTDRKGILDEISNAIVSTDTNINQKHTEQKRKGICEGYFWVEVKDTAHLSKIIKNIKNIDGVSFIYRKK